MPSYQRIVWIGLTVATIAILAIAYFLFLAPAAEKKEVTVPETTSLPTPREQPIGEAGEDPDAAIVPLDLELDQSDGAVRDIVAASGVPESMKEWLRQKNIVRTLVAAVDSIARGESPAALLPFLAPAEKFPVVESKGKLFMDARGFRRYDPLVEAFMAVPDHTWVAWYKTLRPTLEKAFRELGYPGITFEQRARQAIEHLAQTPLPGMNIALERKVLSYAYADVALEELSSAQKHLLRLGPANAARVQKKLDALGAALKFFNKK